MTNTKLNNKVNGLKGLLTKEDKMEKYRLQKEANHLRISDESRIFIEAESMVEVKDYLKANSYEFVRYSEFSDTVYYK